MKRVCQKSRMKRNERRAYGWPEMIYFQLGYLICLKHNGLISKQEYKDLRKEFASFEE